MAMEKNCWLGRFAITLQLLMGVVVFHYLQATADADNVGKIVFQSSRSGNGDIWIMEGDDSAAVQLTTNPGPDTEPCVSPDGRRIAFVSNRSGGTAAQYNDLWVMNLNGSDQHAVASLDGFQITTPAWSPDGKKIAFGTHNRPGPDNGTGEIYVVYADGYNKNLTNLTKNNRYDTDHNMGKG